VMTPRGAHYNRVTLIRLEFNNGATMRTAADQLSTGCRQVRQGDAMRDLVEALDAQVASKA